MKISRAPLAGAYLLEIDRADDERGFFARTFCANEISAYGMIAKIAQCSISFNRLRGTLRGLHYQKFPHQEEKIVRCTSGRIFDVVVDLRPDSSTRHKWWGVELSSANRISIYIPAGMAHGFITLEDDSEVSYMISEPFSPGAGHGVLWKDPLFAIRWPIEPIVISEKDQRWPLLAPEAQA